jgi:hypothetical protein
MPRNIVEEDQWNEPVSLPEPGVDRDQWGVISEDATTDNTNRTRWLRNRLEQVWGDSGSIGNIGDVDANAVSNGFVLRWDDSADEGNGQWVATALPESGMVVLENGSEYQPQLLSDAVANGSDIAGFASVSNAAIALDSAQFVTGSQSLRLRSAAAGDMSARMANTLNAAAGGVYRAQAQFRALSAGRLCRVGLVWLTAADAVVSTAWSDVVSSSNSGWLTAEIEATAPALTAKVYLIYEVQGALASNEDHYVDASVLQRKLVPRSQLNFSAGVVSDNPAADAVDVDVSAITAQAESILSQVEAAQADLQSQALIYALALGG